MTVQNEAGLLPLECSILDMVSQGAKNAEIADRLQYSLPWVKYYVSRLMREFGARNRAELAVMASHLGAQPPQSEECYRVTHFDGLTPVLGDSCGAQFQASARDTSVRIVIRVDQALAMSVDLHRAHEHRILVALVRRLRSYLDEGIDLGRSYHEVVIDRKEELMGLLEPPKCDCVDADASRFRAASASDPAGGAIALDACRCNLPPVEIRCQNLAIITIQGALATGITQAEKFQASAVSCRGNQPLSPGRVDECIPGRCDRWSIMLKPPRIIPKIAEAVSQPARTSFDARATPAGSGMSGQLRHRGSENVPVPEPLPGLRAAKRE